MNFSDLCPQTIELYSHSFEAAARHEREKTPLKDRLEEALQREDEFAHTLAAYETLLTRIANLIGEKKICAACADRILAEVETWERERQP